MSLPAALLGPTGHWAGPPVGGVGWAVALAVLSTCCYAGSAVAQEREAARAPKRGRVTVWWLLCRPRWWLAIAATIVGAALHIAALVGGPVGLIQPLGVLTLVIAVPLGARLSGRAVAGRDWAAVAAVALGLAVIVSLAPHSAPHAHLSAAVVLGGGAWSLAAAGVLTALAMQLTGRRIAPVIQAAGAATLFGYASAMARVAVTGGAPFLLAAALAVLGSVSGLGLAQLAYRGGGLGAPLATLNLIDPLVAAIVGITLLGEPYPLTPTRITLGVLGLAVTAAGVGALTRFRTTSSDLPDPGSHDPGVTARAAHSSAAEMEIVHVVR